jgi:hypothetical protein
MENSSEVGIVPHSLVITTDLVSTLLLGDASLDFRILSNETCGQTGRSGLASADTDIDMTETKS